jgi:hypothetical protein
MEKPLSYSDGTSNASGGYRLLLVILDGDPHNRITKLKTSNYQFTYQEMEKQFYTQGAILPPHHISTPLVKHASFLPALLLGFACIKQLSSLGPDDKETILALIARLIWKMEIQIVPWHKSDKENTWSTVTHGNWWMMIKHTGTTNA